MEQENKKDKKGILSRIFGAKKSGCCNLKIEEVTEEQKKEPTEEARRPQQRPPCCGG